MERPDEQKKKQILLETDHIYVGPQGAAATVILPRKVAQWYQVENASPHVPLMVNQGYETQELGPMIQEALQVQQWKTTDNPLINLSKDDQFIRIEFPVGDQGIAERVLLDKKKKR